MWHPLDMAAAFRSIRPTSASPSTSPEKGSPTTAAHGAFSVNTLLNQSSPESFRFSSTHPTLTAAAAAAAAAHQHQLFSALFQHYPYATAFRPLLNASGSTSLLAVINRFKDFTLIIIIIIFIIIRIIGISPSWKEIQIEFT